MDGRIVRRSRFSALIRWSILAIVGLLIALAFALLNTRQVPRPNEPPSAREARLVGELLKNASGAAPGQPVVINTSAEQLAAAAKLGGRAVGINNLRAQLTDDLLIVKGSRSLPLGLWLNASLEVAETRNAPTEIAIRLGRLKVPRWLQTVGLGLARRVLKLDARQLPDPATPLQSLKINGGMATFRLLLPPRIAFDSIMRSGAANPVDPQKVKDRYCALTKIGAPDQWNSLAPLVRTAFSPQTGSQEQARETAIALAMLVVSPKAGTVAGIDSSIAAECPPPPAGWMLHGRNDLAKHWTLSLALAATYGTGMATAMGELKEVADSAPRGSGFSYVDLAADRSGILAGERLADPARVGRLLRTLRKTDEQTLLPLRALAFAEGLSETEFARRYKNIDNARYAAVVKRIDRVLAGQFDR